MGEDEMITCFILGSIFEHEFVVVSFAKRPVTAMTGKESTNHEWWFIMQNIKLI